MGILTKELSKPFKEGNNTLSAANRLYIQKDFEITEGFAKETETCYSSEARDVDFSKPEEARTTINSWVEEKTLSKIKEILPKKSVKATTKLVLVNAIYFYGSWKYEFNQSLTTKQDFHLRSNETKENPMKVDMMSQEGNFTFYKIDGAEMLKLDYTEDRFSMFIVLPDEKDGLPEVARSFRDFDFKDHEGEQYSKHAKIFIPRFEFKANYEMKKALSEAGMSDVFDDKVADLSGITGQKGQLYVSEIYHQAFISVNEKGTEAAAATAIVNDTPSPSQQIKTFRCDRPFLINIVENKFGSVIFDGLVFNPRPGSTAEKE